MAAAAAIVFLLVTVLGVSGIQDGGVPSKRFSLVRKGDDFVTIAVSPDATQNTPQLVPAAVHAHVLQNSTMPNRQSSMAKWYASSSPSLAGLLEVVAVPNTLASSEALRERQHELSLIALGSHVNTSCGHSMSGVDDDSLHMALNRTDGTAGVKLRSSALDLRLMQGQRVFIAANLHQSQDVLPHWIAELIRLVLALKKDTGVVDNLFVSIYESGSTDHTGVYLATLRGHLKFLGVPHEIVQGTLLRGNRNRIDFLSECRNRALEPLVSAEKTYDRVIYLNDIYFCADGVLQLLFNALPVAHGGLGADAVCGMDYYQRESTTASQPPYGKECEFYDIWAAKDMNGHNFASEAPTTMQPVIQGTPFQVFSCWNGMVVFAADVFQKKTVAFRRNQRALGECPASETELLFRDMWKLGRGKIAVSPMAASAYTKEDFKRCALPRQPKRFHHVAHLQFDAAPHQVSCCPLPEHSMNVDFGKCFNEFWDRFDVEGLPLSKSTLHAQRGAAALAVGSVLLGIAAMQLFHFHSGQPITASPWLVLASAMLLEILNQVVLSAAPFPIVLLMGQMALSSVLLVLFHGLRGGIKLFQELYDELPSVVSWSLIAPLSLLVFITSMLTAKAGSSSLLLAATNALPLASLVLEPLVISRTAGPSFVSLFALTVVAMVSLFFALVEMHSVSETHWTPFLVLLHGVALVARQFAMRYYCASPRMALSFRARVLVENLSGLVFAFPVLLVNWEEETSKTVLRWLWHDTWAWACIFFSGCASLCLAYYGLVLQSKVSTTKVLTVHSAKKVLVILLALIFSDGHLTFVNGSWCLLILAGLLMYGMDSGLLGHPLASPTLSKGQSLKQQGHFSKGQAAKLPQQPLKWPHQGQGFDTARSRPY